MATVKSGINKVGNNYYQSLTQEMPDGGVGTTLFRVDAQGKNGVPVYDVDKPSGSTSLIKSFDPNATPEEQRLLSDPNSQLSQVRSQQVTSSNPYAPPVDGGGSGASPPTATQKSDLAKAGGASGNTANKSEDGSQQAGQNKNGDLATAISSSDKNRDISKYPINELLKYPIDLNQNEQDFISFTMLKYSPKKFADLSTFGATGTIGGRDSQETRRGSTVVLPIQPSISDTNTVDWNTDSMDAFSMVAASGALNTISEGAEGAEKSATGITALIGKGNSDLKTVAAAKFAEMATGTKGLLTRVTGGIVNPNMELLFNGPQLRTFQFNIVLSSREPKESKNIRNIIRFFKQGMSVKRSNTDLFLQSPHTFQIKYNYKGSEHPWINKIKECALTGCTVNYTPAGSYATFIDGAMTSYEIGLQFAELEALYDDDYVPDGGKGNESEIGY